MDKLKLSKRLMAIANLIPKDGGVCDVGTDHGYIPTFLALEGFNDKLLASDINREPLESAKRTARLYGQEDKLKFLLGAGLERVKPFEVSTIVVAGMGGETIAKVLEDAPWTKECEATLILQPMTKADILRSWLFENGYKIIKEELVLDDRVYEIIVATAGSDTAFSKGELLIGHLDLIKASPLLPQKIQLLMEKEAYAIKGLSLSKSAEKDEKIKNSQEILDDLSEIKLKLGV